MKKCFYLHFDTYPEDLKSNLSTELKQFHSYIFNINLVQQKLPKLDSVMLNSYKVFVEDNMKCAFLNVGISLCISLTLMVTNCTTECSFSQMKHIKNPNRKTMRQERLESLSLLMIEADLLCQINFEDLIKDFANKKM